MVNNYCCFISFNRKYRKGISYLQTGDPHALTRLNKCAAVVMGLPGLQGFWVGKDLFFQTLRIMSIITHSEII